MLMGSKNMYALIVVMDTSGILNNKNADLVIQHLD